MRWRGFILIAVLVGLGAWLFSSRKPDRPPNVLLVTIDTLRTDRIGCYGYKAGETPASDRLAREGIVFERAFTPVPVTRPAHASILTGLSPRRHGVRDNLNSQLGGNEVTLPELLEDVGYQTFAVVSASPLVAASGLNQGFSRYLDQLGGSLQTGTVQTHLIERPAGETTRHAIRLLEQRDPDRPFFLWIHYFDPHAEYRAPEPFFTRFSGRRYDGEVAYCESELEKVLGYLSRSGEDDRTLVIYTSDHGEGLGEHGEDAHGHFLFDSTLRVPLIIRLPGGARSGTRFREPVSLLDLFSTVQSVAGIPNTRPGDGVDLASLWNGEGIKDRVLYAESFYSLGHFGWSPL
ncbi:MAG: sulfatase, partial [Planctomycetota bacterium]|nr:sulfatase [Planctomycetota bacterium]